MRTVKAAGFLRIWQVILFIMTTMLFMVVGGVKIAYARECNHRYFDSWGIHGEEYCKLYED